LIFLGQSGHRLLSITPRKKSINGSRSQSTNNVILKFYSYENTIYFVPYSLLGNGCDSAKAQDMENLY
jgi:hypothetical protein